MAADRDAITGADGVRKVLGDKIERIRRARGYTVRDLSALLKSYGLGLSASGVSDVENASRKVSVDELLVIAIALNTSVVDLLTPADLSALEVADNVRPIPPEWLELWIAGESPWPPDDDDLFGPFFDTASERRRLAAMGGLRPEVVNAEALTTMIRQVIEGRRDAGRLTTNEIYPDDDPKAFAEALLRQLDTVNQYVRLLADHIEKHGYGSR